MNFFFLFPLFFSCLAASEAEKYFSTYSIEEYLHSNGLAPQHLMKIFYQFPQSERSMDAHLIFALRAKKAADSLRDSSEREIKLKEAIFSVEAAKQLFEGQEGYGDLMSHGELLCARCFLEIAEICSETKKKVYLTNAEELLIALYQKESLPDQVLSDVQFLLPNSYLLLEKHREAEKCLKSCMKNQSAEPLAKSYFLLGVCQQKKGEYQEALETFSQVDERLLTSKVRLMLLLAMADAYCQIGDFDASFHLASCVINDPTASSLRIEAMFLRARLYELQGRGDLARSQLEAIVRIGGNLSHRAEKILKEGSCIGT